MSFWIVKKWISLAIIYHINMYLTVLPINFFEFESPLLF